MKNKENKLSRNRKSRNLRRNKVDDRLVKLGSAVKYEKRKKVLIKLEI